MESGERPLGMDRTQEQEGDWQEEGQVVGREEKEGLLLSQGILGNMFPAVGNVT